MEPNNHQESIHHNNVDPDVLKHFNQDAASWWDLDGPYRTLHHINPIRLLFMQQSISLTHQNILDVGCGGGILSESMVRAGAKVLGIDLADEALIAANKHRLELANDLQSQLSYQLINAESLAEQQPGSFDIITCMELLEHVPSPSRLVKACAKLLKPGGYLFVSTINRSLKAYLSVILAGEYLFKLLPIGTHDYSQLIKPAELAHWLMQAGLKVSKLSGMDYHPLTQTATLCKNVDINYLISAYKENYAND